MTTKPLEKTPMTAMAAVAVTQAVNAAESKSVDALIAGIKDPDDRVRGDAWQSAASCGAAAVKPLANVMTDPGMEVARAAKRALWKIVRHAGRPGAADEQKAVAAELRPLLAAGAAGVRREILWMLSEIGGDESVDAIAVLLSDPDLRDDARMTLERVPGKKSVAALQAGFAAAPEDFKYNLAVSLRKRGSAVRGYPSQKLTPTRPTNVKAVAAG